METESNEVVDEEKKSKGRKETVMQACEAVAQGVALSRLHGVHAIILEY